MTEQRFPVQFPRDSVILRFPDWLVAETPAWIQHIPFAFWLINATRPNVLVELGTHYANSYFAFGQAVVAAKSETSMYAVDTWMGDPHSGPYGNEVFEAVSGHNDLHFSSFSSLVRNTFDEAAEHFHEREIDLLHIDGHHSYESVKRDFETWLPFMSERGVVLLHDVAVRERGFGVSQLWAELSEAYPSFSFLHGHGLGVLGVGSSVPQAVKDLLELDEDSESVTTTREIFSRLGGGVAASVTAEAEIAAVRVQADEATAQIRVAAAEEIAESARRHDEQASEREAEHQEQLAALRLRDRLAVQRAAAAFDRGASGLTAEDILSEHAWDV